MTTAEINEWLKNHVATPRDAVLKVVDEAGKKKEEK
jgi:hypothetical protein